MYKAIKDYTLKKNLLKEDLEKFFRKDGHFAEFKEIRR